MTASVWPSGESEMAARMRAHDWAATPLGPCEDWPQNLRALVELMLATCQLATIAVGPERIFLYNDEASRHYGARHPDVLGQALTKAFAHEFETVAPFYDRVFAGDSVHVPGQPLDPAETGQPEVFDAYLTPVRDVDGLVIAAYMTGSAIGDRERTAAKLRESEAQLRAANETLEMRVSARTAELLQVLDALQAEALERVQAEAQLRQAQKMEAVGQLTGGIAHDFNNMLQAIGGSLEMVRRRVGQGRVEEAEQFVEGACRTVERAAALTHRLLAFARRQALQPRAVDPDALAEGVAELIKRTVGPDVTVELHLHDGTWPVLCDPHQLEGVLLNLAINARDAMPKGGRLSIATRHVSLTTADVTDQEGIWPGDYVDVSVADTGTGMDEATKARAFEPFFTTKPLGQGTGLGLSQLYGFMRQSRGIVRLDSAPGQGTTVRLYLPRQEQGGSDAGATGPDATVEAAQSGDSAGETILLVEDEAEMRAMAAEQLRELGYRVWEAADGPEALRVLYGSRSAQVDALVTDVGLPNGLNGRQLAEMARERCPGLPVLFITGYAGDVLEEQLAPGMAVIGKPFALNVLAAKLRAMVGGSES